MATLSEVWKEAEWYLDNGISIIPVRDKEEVRGDKIYAPKTPYSGWKQFQLNIIERSTLYGDLEYRQTFAIAMINGKVSGNMETIDIDVKHWPGIDARYFSDIKAIYPDLFDRLRIHKTPSGGFHIPYRIQDAQPPGNLKLCSQKDHKEAGIETRGEGGYVLVPPSLGYKVVKNNPIPTISQGERDSLIALAKSYDEKAIAKVKEFKPTRQQSDYYDENPFEHYNNSPEAEALLVSHGFKEINRTPAFIQFTRPGKANGVSATFNIEKRLFYFFTTSTQFEAEKWYQPCSVLAEFECSGDKKALYKYLVEKGYGKIKAKVEQRIVKATAMKGGKLPANFSLESQERLVVEGNEIKNRYPHGIFWVMDEYGDYTISRERLYHVADGLGYRLYEAHQQIVQISGYIAKVVTDREFTDGLKAYIKEEDASEYEKIANAYESFMQRSGKFTSGRLPLLDMSVFVRSTKYISYKFFNNCFLKIRDLGVTEHPYTELEGKLIWDTQVLKRNWQKYDWEYVKEGIYYDYLDKAFVVERHDRHLLKCIGYLAHEYKNTSMGYIMVLVEEVPDPKQGGGSGKNIFTDLLGLTTTHMDIPGSQIKYDNSLLQAWNLEKVVSISDVRKDFDFAFLKPLSTNGSQLKKLYKDVASISADDMPKFVVSSNYSYENVDGGLKRRIIPLEITNFFTAAGGVDTVYGKQFPDEWSDLDYHLFDNVIIQSIIEYLKAPKLKAPELSEGGWIKQFDQQYKPIRHFIEENWPQWTKDYFVDNETFNQKYEAFCKENNISARYALSSIKMNNALEAYSKKFGYTFEKDVRKYVDVKQGPVTVQMRKRGRSFIPTEPPF